VRDESDRQRDLKGWKDGKRLDREMREREGQRDERDGKRHLDGWKER